ncbi:MAG: metalloregulator ArsR/SmtB family transcription factor [Alphaproteobacteria bacterium]|nr:metalloregulator ArsR/SmtB family transcription factor [Alphaproteobacteria bacterium]
MSRTTDDQVSDTEAANEIETPAFGDEFAEQMLASASQAAEFIRSIGNEHRLMILCTLMDRSKTVTEICEDIGARQSLVSQHLARLRLVGLVTVEREGHFAHYSIGDPLAREIVKSLHERFCPKPPVAVKQ